MTHLRALQNKDVGDGATFYASLQRLQAAEASIAMSCQEAAKDANSKGGVAYTVLLLFHHGIAGTTLRIILTVIKEVCALLDADRQQLSAKILAGAHTSFITCMTTCCQVRKLMLYIVIPLCQGLHSACSSCCV